MVILCAQEVMDQPLNHLCLFSTLTVCLFEVLNDYYLLFCSIMLDVLLL